MIPTLNICNFIYAHILLTFFNNILVLKALHLVKRFMCINYVSVTRPHIIHQQSLINSLTHWCSSRIIFTVVYLNVSDYAGLSEICLPKQARRGGRPRRPDDATASTSASGVFAKLRLVSLSTGEFISPADGLSF